MTVAKKIEKRPFDVYNDRLHRAIRHGWRLQGVRSVDGKNYHEMVRVYRKRGYEESRYYKIGISAVTGKVIALQSGG